MRPWYAWIYLSYFAILSKIIAREDNCGPYRIIIFQSRFPISIFLFIVLFVFVLFQLYKVSQSLPRKMLFISSLHSEDLSAVKSFPWAFKHPALLLTRKCSLSHLNHTPRVSQKFKREYSILGQGGTSFLKKRKKNNIFRLEKSFSYSHSKEGIFE